MATGILKVASKEMSRYEDAMIKLEDLNFPTFEATDMTDGGSVPFFAVVSSLVFKVLMFIYFYNRLTSGFRFSHCRVC